MTTILLTTLNARYAHSALGLRYLYANMHELQSDTQIVEFTINEQIQSIAEVILEHSPKIIGISVYIWNATETAQLIEILKKVSPDTTIVLGGPEASHMPHRVNFDNADYIISGEGEVAFYELCRSVLDGITPSERFIRASMPDLKAIALPYTAYSDEDVAHRTIYVEASRGCPFECEFCLSSIDEKVRNFPLDELLQEFEILWNRGARSFKFIDRTFNLNMTFANRILNFFLSKEPPYFAHFEVIPDHFPDVLKSKIALFPPGSLQLEIGIQTLDPIIAKGINRPLKLEKIYENLQFLENETKAHMHLDLIVGLPGETIEGFGRNLDKLVSLTHSEIQIGILKNLSGTTLARHDKEHGMLYSDIPPYDILQNNNLSFTQIQKMKRFARFWDLYYNSGNFDRSVKLLWKEEKQFDGFYAFSEWIFTQTLSTWKISLDRQISLLYEYLLPHTPLEMIQAALIEDINTTPGRRIPYFLTHDVSKEGPKSTEKQVTPKRQAKRT
ncbi:MAG: DUF4080 domain-containing protein [Sulfuricurvum sp.]|jgi:radical SAM superfamily enzyme YgiQ (UPF0313 family)